MTAVTGDQYFDDWNGESIVVVTAATVSLYNSFELLLMVVSRFKEWRSLLFISLVVASFGVIPYFVGFMMEYFQWTVYWAAMLVSTVGWVLLITGQSVVLYSRLGLILNNPTILKAVKWMIIVDAIIFHIPTTVVQFGKTYGSQQQNFSHALFYIEKIQMTGFCIQEFIISGLYLWKTVELLRIVSKKGTRRVMIELFIINIIIIIGDIALLVLEYSGQRVMERTFKGFVYSVKLKLEFAILSKLVDLVQSSQRNLSHALADVDTFVDVSRTGTTSTVLSTVQAPRSSNNELPGWMAKLEERSVPHVEHIERKISDPFITRKEV
ncbi:hypothetical protein H2198_004974 [Neophaeococcomyces mojaviensis]|uniref:Uncharacterized protein n=1 Tax=Neophaeococcomyces mojaviensis TaxID=3383035 RepID=A0ACC3A700_9EURO|nr:hypothetical protein H2198_004974 [Knufia sp. JES_112]